MTHLTTRVADRRSPATARRRASPSTPTATSTRRERDHAARDLVGDAARRGRRRRCRSPARDGGLCVIVDAGGNALTSDTVRRRQPDLDARRRSTPHALNGVVMRRRRALRRGRRERPAPSRASRRRRRRRPAPGRRSSQTTATLTATVDPGDAALTDCHFDYGTDDGLRRDACRAPPSPTPAAARRPSARSSAG